MNTTANHVGRMAARLLKSLHATNGEARTAAMYASAQHWADQAPIVAHLKNMVGGMTGAELLYTEVARDFSAAVRPRTILGRMLGMRLAPLNVRVLTGIGGTSAGFVGRGAAIPVSRADIAGTTLRELKISGLTVVSTELFDATNAGAEDLLIEDLVAACAEACDAAFLDPGNTGIADEKPASVTSGVVALTSTGNTAGDIETDLTRMLDELIAAGSTLVNAVWVLSPRTAVYLASLRATGAIQIYPTVSALGGTLRGLPVLVSGNIASPGSPTVGHIILLDAAQIVYANDGGAEITVSKQGSLQMTDVPTNNSDTGTPTTVVSLFQSSAAAVKAVLYLNWTMRRPYVSVLAGVTF
jgi:HK97 family phage major capsid protein